MSASQTSAALIAAFLFGAAPRFHAQIPPPAEPPALTALRAEFLGRVVAGSRQLSDQFGNALVKLEDELAAAGDYEDAMQVQARRQELEATLAQSPSPAPRPGVAMTADAAKTSSAVSIEAGALTGWRTTGSYAEWTLQKLPPGRYTVELSYILADAQTPLSGEPSLSSRFAAVDVAKFKFYETSMLASVANIRLLEMERTADAVTWSALTADPISISRSSITLRLEALQGYGANTVRIKDIRLVPVEEKFAMTAGASATLPATGEKDVETLKQRFTKQFADARAPLIVDYQARLKTLAARPSVTRDEELSGEIDAEKKRVDGSAPPLPGVALNRKRPGPAGAAGLDGFEDIRGARLVADPANTADRLKMEHAGRQFWIKLAWVRCPPFSADDKDALHAATKYFKIDEGEALAVGRMAREFAAGYLEGRPLRLLVRSGKNARDAAAAPALVFLDDTGLLFQMVLIDHGFAALAPPPGERRPANEAAMMSMLSTHEKQARERKPAPGAWSFQGEEPK